MKKKLAALLAAALLFTGCAYKKSDASVLQSGRSENIVIETDDAGAEVLGAETEIAEISVSEGNAPFSVTMLDVGQGLSVLVEADGEYLLYDGGDRDTSSYVVAHLKEEGVDTISVMVASHYDSDHIAGLIGVLNTTEVETVLCPDYESDTSTYESFVTILDESGAEVICPDAGDTFLLGSAEVQVVCPASYDFSDENDCSVGIRIIYGDFSVIMCGDAGEESEEAMLSSGLDLDSDLYIVNHHGSAYSSTKEFVSAVSPGYAFISCGLGNSYGHPAQSTLDTLYANSASIWRSDLQGEVTAYSDGSSVWFSTDPSDNWSDGDAVSAAETSSNANDAQDTAEDEGTGVSDGYVYVLNTNTMKFHLQTCSAVLQMSDKNKEFSSLSRQELILLGYEACGLCSP